jgi:2-polyprenyl-3-methyl-5-hydroxy-6-metoxy-1,4-benzoquinol methylase
MSQGAQIEVSQVPACLLCGREGQPLYCHLTDRMFDVPGEWGYLQCPACSLVWLNPRPVPEDLIKTYKTYYTHGQKKRFADWRKSLYWGLCSTLPGFDDIAPGWIWKWAGTALSWIPAWREQARLGTMCLDAGSKGKLLDVGCGDGGFLSMMRSAGWEVAGVEPDPAAASVAREKHPLSLIAASLSDPRLTEVSVDVVTLSHVIEHVPDPIQLLRQCRRILKPRGKIVILTPNLASHGHRLFHESWVPLDPPRHLYLFRSSTLGYCCKQAGFSVEKLRTSTRDATWVWAASKTIQQKGRFNRKADFTWKLRFEGVYFQLQEESTRRGAAGTLAGEELALIGRNEQ